MNRWKALACAAAATLGISMLAHSPASAATGFTFERPGARVVGNVSVSGNTVYLSGTVKDTPRAMVTVPGSVSPFTTRTVPSTE
jgi:hypothetical protein